MEEQKSYTNYRMYERKKSSLKLRRREKGSNKKRIAVTITREKYSHAHEANELDVSKSTAHNDDDDDDDDSSWNGRDNGQKSKETPSICTIKIRAQPIFVMMVATDRNRRKRFKNKKINNTKDTKCEIVTEVDQKNREKHRNEPKKKNNIDRERE